MAEIEIPHGEGRKHEKAVGILIAIMAIMTAIFGSFGTNAANERIVAEVKSSNDYAWYQAKRQRVYANELELKRIAVQLAGNPSPEQRTALEKFSADLIAKNAEYKGENEKIQSEAAEEKLRAKLYAEKNEGFDHGELILQFSVVLCTLTLLTEAKMFMRIGICVAIVGVVLGGSTFFKAAEVAVPAEAQAVEAKH
jgi:hypothetical protein